MYEFFRCVAEALAENGVKGLAKMVPGGGYIYDVGEKALKKYKERRDKQKQHDDFLKLAGAKIDEARDVAVKVVQEVFAKVPVGAPAEGPASPEELEAVGLYLTAIPEALRQSLKRADDITGTTLPVGFDLRDADDVVKVLPPRPPRFRSGAPLPGKPGWVLDRLLGMGGFGEVWFAKHPRMAALGGAVKFCFGQTGRDLVHEAELIDRVMQAGPHPNIVPLRDVCLEGEAPWLMFEYVAGGCLTDWIHQLAGTANDKRLAQAVAAIKQLASAVGFFHALPRPVVHRDLKPSNVLLDKATKKLRITDFGIGAVTARETNRQESRGHSTRGGRLLSYLRGSHTPLYSSPQQRTGADPDPRDDVHALGVIAYQMLTGKLDAAPGPGGTRALKRAGCPDDLAELVLRCASEELEDRPTDANELSAELAKLGSATDAPAEAPVKPAPPPLPATPVAPKPAPVRKPGERIELALPGGVTMPFAYCPPGEFLMGSPTSEKDRESNELQHRVVISKGFYMGVGPVTRGQFARFAAETNYKTEAETSGGGYRYTGSEWKLDANCTWRTPGFTQTDAHPVVVVSWNDTVAFCEWATRECQREVRLPTEAEWEYACRGGTTTPYYFGAQLNGKQANCDGNYPYGTSTTGPYLKETTPVGAYAAKFPHPWGLSDVHGNVWEWCSDWYDSDYYKRSSTTDPRCDDGEQKYRVLRGGSWFHYARFCRAAYRYWFEPAFRCYYYGFRLLSPCT
jgi:formylglycine-generating enzyme required for sulfatase activity